MPNPTWERLLSILSRRCVDPYSLLLDADKMRLSILSRRCMPPEDARTPLARLMLSILSRRCYVKLHRYQI